MSLIEKIDAEMQTINPSDTWEVKLMKYEFNRALLIAEKIILSEQKEPIGNTEQFEDKPMLLSEFLYKCIATNDLVYCNTMDEDGGFMMRGNDWNTETAKKYYITRVSVNSAKSIQCRIAEMDYFNQPYTE